MNTQKLLFLLMAFVVIGSNAFSKPDDKKAVQKTISYSIDTYIETLKSRYSTGYAAIIAENAKFNLNRSGKVFTHGKSEELKAHSKNNAITQNCEVNYTVITASENYALINVSMK